MDTQAHVAGSVVARVGLLIDGDDGTVVFGSIHEGQPVVAVGHVVVRTEYAITHGMSDGHGGAVFDVHALVIGNVPGIDETQGVVIVQETTFTAHGVNTAVISKGA